MSISSTHCFKCLLQIWIVKLWEIERKWLPISVLISVDLRDGDELITIIRFHLNIRSSKPKLHWSITWCTPRPDRSSKSHLKTAHVTHLDLLSNWTYPHTHICVCACVWSWWFCDAAHNDLIKRIFHTNWIRCTVW